MKTNVGALLFGAAVLSLFVPKRRNEGVLAAPLAQSPRDEEPNRLYALVQTRPTLIVLAISASIDELEREVFELNETWNHWALRTERHRFEIQPAPVLCPTGPRVASRAPEVARRS